MNYIIQFYSERVRKDILGWPSGISASFARITEQMVESGPNLGMPYTKALGNGLFEIRAKGPEGIGRAFFCTLVGQRVVVLHGFIKKTQQTPVGELRIALRRLAEVKHG